jgi:prepilin-type N-terminal cleavage/methylation domain-containing protein/prepilin-type processing-associated H-X9-DG protein
VVRKQRRIPLGRDAKVKAFRPFSQDPQRAFTLIELLVVIGIIGILSALLLGAVSRSKGTAQKAACLSNHRQLVLGWQMYADDHQGKLVINVDDGDGLPFTNWVAGQLRNPSEGGNADLLVDKNRSLLSRYVPNPKVYKCPSDKSGYVRSVSMNNRMNPVRPTPGTFPLVLGGYGTNYMIYRRTGDLHNPSKLFIIIDERGDSINEANFAVDMSNTGDFNGQGSPSPYWWMDTPGTYHNNGVALSFGDGHVEHHKWQENTTLGPIGVTGPRHTSDTDRDIAWLQERTAERK